MKIVKFAVGVLFSLFLFMYVDALSITPSSIDLVVSPNSSTSSYFSFSVVNITDIDISYNSMFEITFYPQSRWVAIQNITIPVNFTVYAPEYFRSGSYNSTLFVMSENGTKNIDLDIIVLEYQELDVVPEINKTLECGDVGYFLINLTNKGNVNLNVNFTFTTSLLDSVKTTIYPDMTTKVPVFFEIPLSYKPGEYKENITLSAANISKNIRLNLYIEDKQLPEIVKVEFNETIRASKENLIRMWVEDNVNISVVWITLEGEYTRLTKNSTWYECRVGTEELGAMTLVFGVNDTSGNSVTTSDRMMVSQLDGCSFFEYKPYIIENRTTLTQPIFKSGEKVKLNNINLETFSYISKETGNEIVNTSGYQLYVTVNNQRFDLELQRPYENLETDSITLSFQGSEPGHFVGEVRLSFPGWVHDSVLIDFAGEIGVISVAPYYSDYFGGHFFECSANYSGFIHNSSYDCVTHYPIDIDLDKIAIPLTRREYDNMLAPLQKERDDAIDWAKAEQAWKYLFIGILIILIIVGVVFWFGKSRGITFILR